MADLAVIDRFTETFSRYIDFPALEFSAATFRF